MNAPAQQRTFEDKPATRERVQLLLALIGPSGGGKTYSALRLATGIQRVVGGEIFFIDTESRRALHYAWDEKKRTGFHFRHVPFAAPFGPLDYLAALEHCAKKGAKTIIVDSFSHEHEGPGGVLELHERELQRMAGDDYSKRARMQGFAWGPAKRERRRLINSMMQMGAINLICCFRAKEKLDWTNKNERGEPTELGWMPIAGEEFVFEMTLRALLPPGADGKAQWQVKLPGEQTTVKLPTQFRELCSKPRQFDEDMGEEMARWCAGDTSPAALTVAALLDELRETPNVDAWKEQRAADIKRLSKEDKQRLAEAGTKRREEIAAAAAAVGAEPSTTDAPTDTTATKPEETPAS